MSLRNYTTWEEDFLSERRELKGYDDELVAVVDCDSQSSGYYVVNPAGIRVLTGAKLQDAIKAAEEML